MPAVPTSIDAYLAKVKGLKARRARPAPQDHPRRQAEECISYRMPAFRLDGRIAAGFAATAKGCSYFPFSGSTLRTLADELADYEQTKSSLHFDPAEPLPRTLVRKLIKARLAEG
jgi:uncharacterized protein YdhG (YjbR/CyaY superfamily)